MTDGNQEFPVPLNVFSKTLLKTEEEVWIHLLEVGHNREKRTMAAWRRLLDGYKRA